MEDITALSAPNVAAPGIARRHMRLVPLAFLERLRLKMFRDERLDKFSDRPLQLELLNLILATILVILDVIGRQAYLRHMHVGGICIRL